MNYKYIITGEGSIAKVFHSDLDCIEFEKYFKANTKKFHPKGHDKIFRWGSLEFINPRLMCVSDFVDFGPAIV